MVSSTGLNHLISFYKKVQVHFGQNKDYPWAPPKGNFPKGRRVKLSDFYIGKYEVTQEEYYSVMKDEVVSVTAYVDGVGERTAEFFMDSRPSVLPKVNLDFFIKANKVV